jgi:small subunit ribosomal protein S5
MATTETEKKVKVQDEKKEMAASVSGSFKQQVLNREKKQQDFADRKRDAMKRISRPSRMFSRSNKKKNRFQEEKEFDVRIVSIRRVTKVRSGGKRMRLSVMVVIGDRKGKIGIAIAKGKDVRDAENKAINRAKKNMMKVLIKGQTIPHEITLKYKAAKIFLKPAIPGTGVIAGGAIRSVVEVAGIKDIFSKVIGSKNTITNVYATFNALKNLKLTRVTSNGTK